MTQHLVAIDRTLAGERDADADVDVDLVVEEIEGVAHFVVDAPAEHFGIRRAGDAGHDDCELVAAEAGNGIGRARHGTQPGTDLADQLVAGGVAERVVDRLEAVEIEIEERSAPPCPRAKQRFGELLLEEEAVGEAGERIVEGDELDLVLSALALGDVAGDADEADESPPSSGQRHLRGREPFLLAVAIDQVFLDVELWAAGLENLEVVLAELSRHLGIGLHVVVGEADEVLAAGKAEVGGNRLVGHQEAAVGVLGEEIVGDLVDHRDEKRALGAPGRLGLLVALELLERAAGWRRADARAWRRAGRHPCCQSAAMPCERP